MGNVRLLTNLKALSKAAIIFDSGADFPSEPVVGQLFYKSNGILYIYSSVSGVTTWYPLTNEKQSYVHTQASPISTWTVVHSLNSTNFVFTVLDTNKNVVQISPTNVLNNQFDLEFWEPTAGTCIVMVSAEMQLPAIISDMFSKSDDNITVKGNLIPDTDLARSLGSATKRWSDVYVGNNSIYIGNDVVINQTGIRIEPNAISTEITDKPEIGISNIKLKPYVYNPGTGNITSQPSIVGASGATKLSIGDSSTNLEFNIGTNKNITFNSSNFKVDQSGNITISGNITAEGGSFVRIDDSQSTTIGSYSSNKIDTLISSKINNSEKGIANGVATLGSDGKLSSSQMPPISVGNVFVVASEVEQLALTVNAGDICKRTDNDTTYMAKNSTNGSISSDWFVVSNNNGDVVSVNGQTGIVSLSKADVGLTNVVNSLQLVASNNLSDLDNVGTARTNLGLASTSGASYIGFGGVTLSNSSSNTVSGVLSDLDSAVSGKASVSHTHPVFVGDTGTGGTAGIVPRPNTGDATRFLKGDGTWAAMLSPSDNLNSLTNKATARTNLGLGDSAIRNVGVIAGSVAAGDHGHSLESLASVNITNPVENQGLIFDGAEWVNGVLSVTTTMNNLNDVTVSTPTAGQSLVFDGSKWVNGNAFSSSSAVSLLTDANVENPQAGQVLKFNGVKWVNGIGASQVSQLTDVSLSTLAANQVLKYDGTKWVNGIGASAVSQLTDIQLGQLFDGQVLGWNSTTSKWENVSTSANNINDSATTQTDKTYSANKINILLGTKANTVHDHDTSYTLKSNNLSDITNASSARTNLGLGDSATKNTGTGANDVAAGNHNHLFSNLSDVTISNIQNNQTLYWNGTKWINGDASSSGFTNVVDALQLVASNNLLDLTDISTARTNLGLGNSSTRNVGTLSSEVAAGDHSHIDDTTSSISSVYSSNKIQNLLTDKISNSEKGSNNGVATLGSDGKLTASQMPPISVGNVFVVASEVEQLALTVSTGDVCKRTDTNTTYMAKNSTNGSIANDWISITPAGSITSVNGQTGVVSITKSDIGLSNIVNSLQLIASNNLSDLSNASTARTNLGLNNVLNSTQLVASLNLSDVPDKAAARANLGITGSGGGSLILGLGSTNAAAGNHSHALNSLSNVLMSNVLVGQVISWNGSKWVNSAVPVTVTKTDVGLSNIVNSLQLVASNNLSDLVNVGTARTNLGLGSSATKNTGTGANDVAVGNHTHTVSSITDVTISNITNNQILKWNGTKWANANNAVSSLSDVVVTNPVANNTLKWDGTKWINLPNNLSTMGDVQLSNVQANEILKYNGTKWVNATAPVGGGSATSVSGLADVALSGPTMNQALIYNGTSWVNTNVIGFIEPILDFGDLSGPVYDDIIYDGGVL